MLFLMVPRYSPCPKTEEKNISSTAYLIIRQLEQFTMHTLTTRCGRTVAQTFNLKVHLYQMFMRRFRICIQNTRSDESFLRYGTSVDRIEMLQTYLTSDQKSDGRGEFAMPNYLLGGESSPKALTVTEKLEFTIAVQNCCTKSTCAAEPYVKLQNG